MIGSLGDVESSVSELDRLMTRLPDDPIAE
jgi:hypothetical protein